MLIIILADYVVNTRPIEVFSNIVINTAHQRTKFADVQYVLFLALYPQHYIILY